MAGRPLGDDGAGGVGRRLLAPHGGRDPCGPRRLRAPPLLVVHRELRPLEAVRGGGDPPLLLRGLPGAPRARAPASVRLSRRDFRRARLPRPEAPLAPEPQGRLPRRHLRVRLAAHRDRSPAGENRRGTRDLRARPRLWRGGHARLFRRARPDGRRGGDALHKPPVVILSGVRWDFLWQRHHTLATLFAGAGYPTVFVETTGLSNPRPTGNTLRR